MCAMHFDSGKIGKERFGACITSVITVFLLLSFFGQNKEKGTIDIYFLSFVMQRIFVIIFSERCKLSPRI